MAIQKGEKLRPMAGGLARAAKLTKEQQSAIGTKAVTERWRLYHAKMKASNTLTPKRKPKAQNAGEFGGPLKSAKL